MPETVTYYAIIAPRGTREKPDGIARRVRDEVGFHDEALGKEMTWHRTGLIAGWERAESTSDLEEISEAEANELIERLRERWKDL